MTVRENIEVLRRCCKIIILSFVIVCGFCMIGSQSVSAKTSDAVMDDTHVFQWDEKYKTVRCYQGTASLYNSGCGLSSINHACNFINETDKSIEEMVQEIDVTNPIEEMYYYRYEDTKGRMCSGASWRTPKIIAEYYGLVATRHNTPGDINTLEQALKDGHCIWTSGIGEVFVGPDGNVKKRNGHCVMFYRYEDGLFYCHDSCEEQYTTYTKEQMETLYSSSLSLCGTWIISKNPVAPDMVDTFKLKSGNGQFYVTAEKPGNLSGYQVRYRVAGNTDWIVKTYLGNENLNANIRELKAVTKYQVQVRTFKNKGKGRYCSKWTLYKSVKTNKAPCGTKVKTLKKAGKKSFTVTAKKTPSITGYQVAYRVKGAKSWSKKTYKTKVALNKTISNLKTATYQVKVRTYRVSGGKSYYSGWSGWKTIKL